MNRRDFLVLGVSAALASETVRAQVSRRPARVVFVGLGSPAIVESRVTFLRRGFVERGFQEGRDFEMHTRAVPSNQAALAAAAAEVVASNPDVIVTHANGTAVFKAATRSIPIVMVSGDAVAAGLVESLPRPGGNVTGISFLSPELMAKRLHILKDVLPAMKAAVVLGRAEYAVTESALEAIVVTGRALGVDLHPALVRSPDDLEGAFAGIPAAGYTGIVVQDEPMLIANAARIASLSQARGLASVGFLELATAGGTIAYSIDFADLWRRAAHHVVRIVQGARPADIPVEQPTGFRLILNLRAAKELRLTVPPLVLAQADEVIE